MVDYIEIQNSAEIKRLNGELRNKLSKIFTHIVRRKVGSPIGSSVGPVAFMPQHGDAIFWWKNRVVDSRGLGLNLFGHGNPDDQTVLLMDIQFNVPVTEFNRRSGGAFLFCKSDKKIYLAHRGIATLGHSRVNQNELIHEANVQKVDAETGKQIRQFMIIGALTSKSLANDLSEFSQEIRRAARTVMIRTEDMRASKEILTKENPTKSDTAIVNLQTYFKEFSGTIKIAARAATQADRFHGDVVDALAKKLKSVCCLKSGPIDLATVTDTRGIIFEVKTSSDSQSIYTAIGQMMVHSPSIKKHAAGLPIDMVIVLPEIPKKYLFDALNKLRIQCILFSRSTSKKISFDGIDDLLA